MRPGLDDIRQIDFPVKPSPEATLSVYEYPKDVPFPIARVFVINAAQSVDRGAHAHRECQQLLVCVSGKISVTIDDGKDRTTIDLEQPGKGLLIPAGLWAEQRYESGAVLMVLASHGYNESDYIRDYAAFQKYAQQA